MSIRTAGPWLRSCVVVARWRDQCMEAVGTVLGKGLARIMVRNSRDSNVESP